MSGSDLYTARVAHTELVRVLRVVERRATAGLDGDARAALRSILWEVDLALDSWQGRETDDFAARATEPPGD